MTKAVLLHKPGSIYDDLPEKRYHFPNGPYLKTMRETVGDWIVYYEPQGSGARRNGRQAYFAAARVSRVDPDPARSDHSYARIEDYIDFPVPVPLIVDGRHPERAMEMPDGTTNRGLRQRAVRRLPDEEFDTIVRLGLASSIATDARPVDYLGMAEEQAPLERPIIEQLNRRPLRDAAFRRQVLNAYDSTCAFTGLRIVNGGGRAEVDAAHIRPVGGNHGGPDTVRNGLALTKTMHWMFDRGIIAVSDNYRILSSPGRMPAQIRGLLNESGQIRLPEAERDFPAPEYLGYHRTMFEEEYGRFEPI